MLRLVRPNRQQADTPEEFEKLVTEENFSNYQK